MTRGPSDILLVEDNPTDIELTLHALRKNKPEKHVAIAHDGAEAWDYLFSRGAHSSRPVGDPPQLILLDLKLPKLSGIQLLKKIKTEQGTKTIPVVVLTSSTEERDIIESYALGVNSYIVKPVDFDQFTNAVQQISFYWLLLNEGARPATGSCPG